MKVAHWLGMAVAGVLLAQPALGQGGGAGGGVPERNPSGPSHSEDSSGAADLNKPPKSEAGEQGTGSSAEEAADAGTHKTKTKKHKHRATKSSEKSSKQSTQSEEKAAPESGGAQGK